MRERASEYSERERVSASELDERVLAGNAGPHYPQSACISSRCACVY